MKVTIDGMTFEGSEDEIERVVKKYGTAATNAYPGHNPQPRGSDWPVPEPEHVVIGLRPGRVV